MKKGEIIEVNEAWVRLMGYERNEVIGRSFMTYIPEKCLNDFQRFLLDISEFGSMYESELIILHSTGREIPVILSAKMLTGGPDMECGRCGRSPIFQSKNVSNPRKKKLSFRFRKILPN